RFKCDWSSDVCSSDLDTVSRGHNDLQNLMAATDFGTLFLDASLRIKRFTQQVTELFSITPSDEGRPVTDFAHRLEYDDLVKDAQIGRASCRERGSVAA